MKTKSLHKKKIWFVFKIWIILFFVSPLSVCSFGQSAIKTHLPLGIFYGEGVDSTSFSPIFNLTSFTYQVYAPITFNEKLVFFGDSGFGVIGCKQIHEGDKYRPRVYGLQLGMYIKYNILNPNLTPYLYSGINLDALFANYPTLALNTGSGNTIVKDLNHRTLFPEWVIGVGFTLLGGGLSIDIQDKVGLISVDPGKTIKSNVISIGVIVHFAYL